MAEIVGDEKVVDALLRAGMKVARRIERQELRKAAKIVQREAKKRAPKLTGALRRSIKVRSGRRSRLGQSVIVGSDLKYSRVVERGSKRQKKQPFLIPALADKRDEIVEAMKAAIKEEIAKL